MVTPRSRQTSPDHLGVSLSATELTVSYVGPRGDSVVRHMAIDGMAVDGAEWPALARALASLQIEPSGARLSISLMPPLAEIRVVELPPLRDDEAERVLARGAGRYFVNARQPQLVGIVRRPATRRGARRTIVAAAAPARLIAAIQAAARAAGFVIDGIGPAESAWAEAATSFWPAFDRGTAFVAVVHADRTDLLHLEGGRLAGVRRFRPASLDAPLIAAAVTGDMLDKRARVAAFGVDDQRTVLARALAAPDIALAAPLPPGDAAQASTPAATAATFAAPASGPLFRTDDARVSSRAGAWRATRLVGAAAILLFLLGAGLQLWGARRKLKAVRDRRASLASALSATLVGRSSVETVYRTVSALSVAQRGVPEWSRTLAELTDAVPHDAYLTAFRTRGDSLIVEGLAAQASAVFNAIEQVPGLANVRAASPVRRELRDDATALERFTLAARQVSR